MSKNSVIARSVGLVASAGLAATPLLLAGGSAFAATDCGTGTEVSAGLCEAVFDTVGDYTFTAPSGVSKIAAVIVAGGGGGLLYTDDAYAGGGGEVVYVDSVDLTAPVSIHVGYGGEEGGSPEIGDDSSVNSDVANGGGVGADLGAVGQGGQSGAGYAGSTGSTFGAGGGAGGSAPDCYDISNPSVCAGGPGVTASSVATDHTLFPALLGEPEYGAGGNGPTVISPSEAGLYAAGHGGDVRTESDGDRGNDGIVILRWAVALPDTGMDVQPWAIGAGVAAVAAGTLLTSSLMRTRRQGRHSA